MPYKYDNPMNAAKWRCMQVMTADTQARPTTILTTIQRFFEENPSAPAVHIEIAHNKQLVAIGRVPLRREI